VIDGYDEAPLCSSFTSGSFDIDVIFHVHCTKPVWCMTLVLPRSIIKGPKKEAGGLGEPAMLLKWF